MEVQFQTMADKLTSFVDCRVIFFHINFCNVPIEVVKAAAIEYYEFVNSFYQDQFVSSWGFPVGESTKYPKDIVGEIKDSPFSPAFILESNVKTPILFTKKHLKGFRKKLFYDPMIPIRSYSVDFDAYYEENIRPCLTDDDRLKEAVLKLFSERRKVPIQSYHAFDSQGLIYSAPEDIGCSFYHGQIAFSIAVGCLGETVDSVATVFSEEMRLLCTLLKNAGGIVGMCPYELIICKSTYMRYFPERELPEMDAEIPEGCYPHNWNRVSYLFGCEWANVLSPAAKERLGASLALNSDTPFVIDQMPSGCLYVQLKMPISEVDVDDLLGLKRFLYPALYPGRSDNLIDWGRLTLTKMKFPRSSWELLPIFPDELSVRNGKIIFEKKICD